MWIEKTLYKLLGWKYEINVEIPDKCIACIAPHTSNWDFFYGVLFLRLYGLKANFFIKQEWMRPPVGWIIKKLGGIGIRRNRKQSTTDVIAEEFAHRDVLRIGITPEGTRSLQPEWKLGFYYIAQKAQVPILLSRIDYSTKTIALDKIVIPNSNSQEQIAEIKAYYQSHWAKFPEKFGK